MLFDGVQLTQGSDIKNLVVDTGTTFPTTPDDGELFYINGTSGGSAIGLYVYEASTTSWIRLVQASDTFSALLPNIVTPGTYKSLTVQANGLVSAGTNPTTLSGYGIVDAQPLDSDLTAIAALTGTSGILRKTAANTWTLDTTSYLTTNQALTLSGDITGSGTTTITTALVNTGVGAGTYGSAAAVPVVAFDSKGRATSAVNTPIVLDASAIQSGTFANSLVSQSSVTQYQSSLSISESQVSGTGTILARVATNETITGNWTFNNEVTGVDPTSSTHLATKNYVDNVAAGLTAKAACAVATNGSNITLSGLQTIDGYTTVAGDRVLVKDQTNGAQNGIYVAASGAWARSSDMNGSPPNDMSTGDTTFVENGLSNANTTWVIVTTGTITVGTTANQWSLFSRIGGLAVSGGLTLSGNTIAVATASASRIVINANSIDLATVGTSGTYSSVTTDAYGRVVSGNTYALNVAGGAAGSVLYQSAANTTTALALGTTGYVLTAGVSGPYWAASTGGVTSISGTSGQINASSSTGAITLSLPSTVTLSGVAGTSVISQGGGVSAGSLSLSGGSAGGGADGEYGTGGTVYVSAGSGFAVSGGSSGNVSGTAGNVIISSGGGSISNFGGSTTASVIGGYIAFQTAGTVSNSSNGAQITSSPAEVMRITSNGAISFGSSGTNYGSSGQVLTSSGNGSPTWTTPAASGVTSLTAGTGISLSGSTGAVTISSTASSSLTATYIGYGSSSGTITGTSDFTWAESTQTFTIGNGIGSATIQTAAAGTGTGAAPALNINGSSSISSYGGGAINITGGTSPSGSGGGVAISGGLGNSVPGGKVYLVGGVNAGHNVGGSVQIIGADGTGTNGVGGSIILTAGAGGTGSGAASGSFQFNIGSTSQTLVLTINQYGSLGFGSSPSYGTAGQVLTSAGSGASPTWQNLSTGSVSANTLTGTTLASNVVSSSLTSVGTLTGLTASGTTKLIGTGASAPSTFGYTATLELIPATSGTNIISAYSSGIIYVDNNGGTAILMNSTGSAYGAIGNISANLWGIGYITSVGGSQTSSLTWDATGVVNVPTSLTVGGVPVLTSAVTSLTAGTGISLNRSTGAVTISATNSGTITSVAGTANQISASTTGGAVTLSLPQNVVIPTPSSGVALTVNGVAAAGVNPLVVTAPSSSVDGDIEVERLGSTINLPQHGPNITLYDNSNISASLLQQSGGQTELWQLPVGGAAWHQPWFIASDFGLVMNGTTTGGAGATGGSKGAGTINATGLYVNGVAVGTITSVAGTGNQISASTSSGAVTLSLPKNVVIPTPTSGVALSTSGVAGVNVLNVTGGVGAAGDIYVQRAGSTANSILLGPNIEFWDSSAGTGSVLQFSGGQTELWQYDTNGTAAWAQVFYVASNYGLVMNGTTSGGAGATGGSKGLGTINATGLYVNGTSVALSTSSVTINGTAISLGGSGTVTAAAGTLTGTTLASNVVSSSLTSVGTLNALAVTGAVSVGNQTFDSTTTSSFTTPPFPQLNSIDSVSTTTFRTIKYLIQVTETSTGYYHSTEMLVVQNGTTCVFTQYANVYTNGSLGTFEVGISGSTMTLIFQTVSSGTYTVKVAKQQITV